MPIQLENLSPFELSLYLEKCHRKDKYLELLNVGRGNPNWTAPVPREAFFLLGQFATQEITIESSTLIGKKVKPSLGQVDRFFQFLDQHPSKGSQFLRNIWEEGEEFFGLPKEVWLTEIMDHLIGDNYPNPERVLHGVKKPVKEYLNKELFSSQAAPFDIFAVEGGTAGIVYLFDSLVNNLLLNKGDKVALMIPAFAPYLEIPKLPQYEFDVEYLESKPTLIDGKVSYQYSDDEINRLRNSDIKAVFLVNPSNPTANAIQDSTIDLIVDIINTDNPNLMVLTDDVYGTFLEDFRSLFIAAPYNTACIYSYSKYFGSTGWRIGTVAVAKDNLFDQLLSEQSADKKAFLYERYHSLSDNTEEISFIDRMVADSRDVALNHAAGLSGPQQVMMTLFSLYSLLDTNGEYKKEVMAICRERERILFDKLGIDQPYQPLNTAYYCEIELDHWMKERYGSDFSTYVTENWTMSQLLESFAQSQGLILLRADGFGSSRWAVRISLANLNTDQYYQVGQRMIDQTALIYKEWTLLSKIH